MGFSVKRNGCNIIYIYIYIHICVCDYVCIIMYVLDVKYM